MALLARKVLLVGRAARERQDLLEVQVPRATPEQLVPQDRPGTREVLVQLEPLAQEQRGQRVQLVLPEVPERKAVLGLQVQLAIRA